MRFVRQNEPATRKAVLEFAQIKDVRLPEDYIDFLTSNNGGYTGGLDAYVHVPNGPEIIVQQLFGLTESSDGSIAADQFSNFSDWMHARMLEIAYTPNGDTLLMDLRETNTFGKIYLRSHDGPPNDTILIDETGFENDGDYEEAQLLHPVADSFSKFVAMFKPVPE
jgi:hypothetical protein